MSAQHARVLAFSKEPGLRKTIGTILRDSGFNCTCVQSIRGLLRCLLWKRYDAVIIDLSNLPLPAAASKILSRKSLAEKTIYIYDESASPPIGLRDNSLLLSKPLDASRLVHLVHRTIIQARMNAPLTLSITASGTAGQANSSIRERFERIIPRRDHITGLPIFSEFRKRLSQMRQWCRKRRMHCTAIVADLDDFHKVNLEYGYDFGDAILADVADRLSKELGNGIYLARGNGDEFIFLIPASSPTIVEELAWKIRKTIAGEPWERAGTTIPLSVSIGIAQSDPIFSISESELTERARAAARVAGNTGRSSIVKYIEGMMPTDNEQGENFSDRRAHAGPNYIKRILIESISALTRTVEAKDHYTHKHSEHVAFYAEHLAKFINLDKKDIETIRIAGLLHDIGKIAIPDAILSKPGKLSPEEFKFIQRHPVIGAAIVENITYMKDESTLILHHHERWDGKGYPTGLRGEQIPLGSRILCIADSIDAMLMQRTYRRAYTVEQMLDELQRCAASQFDPNLANRAIQWCRQNPSLLILPPLKEPAKFA